MVRWFHPLWDRAKFEPVRQGRLRENPRSAGASTPHLAARDTVTTMTTVTALMCIVLALALGFALGRYRTHIFQNRSEAVVARAVADTFGPPDYHLMNHITLPFKDGTTQIDQILVSRFGVFVIETKDYKGWIFANPKQSTWTQVLFKSKFKFQNPVFQNELHVRVVRDLLDFLPSEAVKSVVVFTGDAEFKTPRPNGVYNLRGLLEHIREHSTEVLSQNRVQFAVGRLETARLTVTRTTDVEHVQRLKRRHGSAA